MYLCYIYTPPVVVQANLEPTTDYYDLICHILLAVLINPKYAIHFIRTIPNTQSFDLQPYTCTEL